jgi:DNA-binding NarL/FixJ family response regulator
VTRRPRILLAEDHALFSQGLRAMIGDTYNVLAVVSDGAEVTAAVQRYHPDVLLLDLSLPNRTGMDILGDLQTLDPAVRVVVVTMHVDPVLVDAAIKLGAAGFVPKDSDLDELRTAIAEVLDGRRYVSPRLPRRGQHGGRLDRMGFDRLTPRQQEIVQMIGQGRATEDMAATLGLSHHTINFHRKNIRRQLGLENDWALLRYAILVGLSESPADS